MRLTQIPLLHRIRHKHDKSRIDKTGSSARNDLVRILTSINVRRSVNPREQRDTENLHQRACEDDPAWRYPGFSHQSAGNSTAKRYESAVCEEADGSCERGKAVHSDVALGNLCDAHEHDCAGEIGISGVYVRMV